MLKANKGLKKLGLRDMVLDASCCPIARIKGLVLIHPFQGDVIGALKDLPELSQLDLLGSNPDQRALLDLFLSPACPPLESLSLLRAEIDVLQATSTLPALKTIYLRRCRTDAPLLETFKSNGVVVRVDDRDWHEA